MAVKKLISSPSASSSSSSSTDSSFERFEAQRAPSLKCEQCDSEGEEKESEDSSSDDDNDSSSDEERFVAQPAPSLKRKQCDSEGKEKESEDSSSDDDDDSSSDEERFVAQPAPSLKRKQCDSEGEEKESEDSSSSSDDDDDSSSDEERFVAQPAPSLKRKQQHSKEGEEKESEGDSSDEEEDEEKAKSPATKCASHPSQTQQSCTEEEKQKENTKESVPHLSQHSTEEEEEEDAKLSIENSESLIQPQKKKLKLDSVQAGKSSSTATNSAVQRVWSLEDELVLLHALSHHHNTYGKVPSSKEYHSFLTSIIGSLSFPATEKQLGNKIRTFKTNYGHRKKNMGSNAKSLNPHEKVVFQICAKLFGDAGKTKSVEGMANNTSGDAVRCSIYLRELISRQKLPTWLSTIEDVVQQLGESRARDLEAKAKQLSIDAMKLHAREEKFIADLFDVVADEMASDG